jgi:hypothetical protein
MKILTVPTQAVSDELLFLYDEVEAGRPYPVEIKAALKSYRRLLVLSLNITVKLGFRGQKIHSGILSRKFV